MTWANNVEIDKISGSGSQWPILLVAKQIRPVVQVEALDLQSLDTLVGEIGAAVTTLDVYLRRRKASMINYDDGDTVHLKLSATAGTAKVLQTQGDRGTDSVEIHLQRPTAGGALFTVTANQAIS
jgi:hypothetical protein